MKKLVSFVIFLVILALTAGCTNEITVSAILFSQENIEINIDDSFQLQYVLVPDNASSSGLVWKSTNPEIAEVDENGNITAIAPGKTTIVFSAENGVFDTCEVTVNAPSAIEQLNEYEKWLFDVIVEELLPTFYNAPAMRLRKIEYIGESEDFSKSMNLLLNIQGTNKLGGTLIKDYMLFCSKNGTPMFLPAITENGLVDRTTGVVYTETTKLDYTKINAALSEYWNETVHN